jgi:site-specific recombinase XerC
MPRYGIMETRRRKPAKKVRKPGQMRPFTAEQITTLEALLRQDGTALRDLALLRTGIDSMLRSSDMAALTVRDVVHNGEVASTFTIRQKKTGK